MIRRLLSDRLVNLLVLLYLALIFSFLLVNVVNLPLWQDEAELSLSAMTLNSHNMIPKVYGYMESQLRTDGGTPHTHQQDKRTGASMASHDSPGVTTRGWIPYYFIRSGIFLFGKNTLGPRFFSPLFFILFLFIYYKITWRYRGHGFALMALIGLSLMPNLLSYALQAGHPIYALFFATWLLDRFLCDLRKPSRHTGVFLVLSEVLLYYTNLQYFFLMNAVMGLGLLVWNHRHLTRYFVLLVFCFFAALPHLFVTGFRPFAGWASPRSDAFRVGWPFLEISVNHNGYILWMAVLFAVLLLVLRLWGRMTKSAPVQQCPMDHLVFLMVCVGYPTICLTTPQTTFHEGIFAPLVPFIFYAALAGIWMLADFIRNTKIAWMILSVVFLMYPVFYLYSEYWKSFFEGGFPPVNVAFSDTRWVKPVIKYIQSAHTGDPLILTSSEPAVFTYYSDFDAQLILPVKKEFIDTTTRELFIVFGNTFMPIKHIGWYHPSDKVGFYLLRKMRKYFNRRPGCQRILIGSVTVCHCM